MNVSELTQTKRIPYLCPIGQTPKTSKTFNEEELKGRWPWQPGFPGP